MDNGKKEFPIDGFEEDLTGKKSRAVHGASPKYIKKKMSKRFRKRRSALIALIRDSEELGEYDL